MSSKKARTANDIHLPVQREWNITRCGMYISDVLAFIKRVGIEKRLDGLCIGISTKYPDAVQNTFIPLASRWKCNSSNTYQLQVLGDLRSVPTCWDRWNTIWNLGAAYQELTYLSTSSAATTSSLTAVFRTMSERTNEQWNLTYDVRRRTGA